MSVVYVDNIGHFGLSVCFLTSIDLLLFFDFLLFEKIYQSNCIKFCIENEIQCACSMKLTVAFDESTISGTQVQLWYNRFNKAREDVNDDAHSARSSRSTTDENIDFG